MARKVKTDQESPEITPELFARMRPLKDVDPGMVQALKVARGRPRLEQRREVVSVRLSHQAKVAWTKLPTKKRTKIVRAMERAALREAAR
jgi:hypothetical protein